jgi:hypothetical protein
VISFWLGSALAATLHMLPFAHHYNGPGQYYPTAAEVRGLAEACLERGLARICTLYLDGILVERLDGLDPDLRDWVRQQGFPIGWHGEDTHGPGPVVADLGRGGQVRGLSPARFLDPSAGIEEMAQALRQRYTHRFEGVQINDGVMRAPAVRVNPDSTGGIARLRRWAGKPLEALTGQAIFQPAAALAFADEAPGALLQDAGPLAAHFRSARPGPEADELRRAVERYLGPYTTLFWFMGQLAQKGGRQWQLPPWSAPGADPERRLRSAIGALPRAEPAALGWMLNGEKAEVAAELDAWLRLAAERRDITFASPASLRTAVLPADQAHRPSAVAHSVLAAWDVGPPDHLRADGRPLSLVDSVEVLCRGLLATTDAEVLTTGWRGPMGLPAELAQARQPVSARALRAALPGLIQAVEAHPRRALPMNIEVEGQRLGFQQLPPLLAQLQQGAAGPLPPPAVDHLPPLGRALVDWMRREDPRADLWMAAQLWTAEPVQWR